jgi:hypothetical protein
VAKPRTHPKAIDRSIKFEKESSYLMDDEMKKVFNKMHLLMAANALAA